VHPLAPRHAFAIAARSAANSQLARLRAPPSLPDVATEHAAAGKPPDATRRARHRLVHLRSPQANNAKEDAKRTLEGLEEDGKGGFRVRAAVIGGTGTVVDAVVGNTLGRVGKLAQEAVLGAVPVEAIEGSFQETKERGAAEAGAAAGAATLDELEQKIEDTLLAGELQARAELASKRGP